MTTENKFFPRVKEILLESDITFAVLLLGFSMILWAVFAIVMAPDDFMTFSNSMKVGATWFWFANYAIVGAGLMYVAVHRLPPGASMFFGGWGCVAWSYIAAIRGFSNITSGVTLNFLVVLVCFLIAQRSRAK